MADFAEDPFKDYRYEDVFNIEDPFADEGDVIENQSSMDDLFSSSSAATLEGRFLIIFPNLI